MVLCPTEAAWRHTVQDCLWQPQEDLKTCPPGSLLYQPRVTFVLIVQYRS